MAHDDFDEDSDWTAHAQQAEPPSSRRPQHVALVVFGIALGAAGASAAWYFAAKSQPHAASVPLTVAPPAAGPVVVPAASAAPAGTQAVAAAAPAAPSPRAEPVEAPAAAAPSASAVRPPLNLSAAEVARRKELAWARYYKRPQACEGNPSADQLIECANDFIRAKREFDERWRNGTL